MCANKISLQFIESTCVWKSEVSLLRLWVKSRLQHWALNEDEEADSFWSALWTWISNTRKALRPYWRGQITGSFSGTRSSINTCSDWLAVHPTQLINSLYSPADKQEVIHCLTSQLALKADGWWGGIKEQSAQCAQTVAEIQETEAEEEFWFHTPLICERKSSFQWIKGKMLRWIHRIKVRTTNKQQLFQLNEICCCSLVSHSSDWAAPANCSQVSF